MNKRIFLPLFCLLFFACQNSKNIKPFPQQKQYNDLKEAINSLIDLKNKTGQDKISVQKFLTIRDESTIECDLISERFISQLAESRQFRIIDKRSNNKNFRNESEAILNLAGAQKEEEILIFGIITEMADYYEVNFKGISSLDNNIVFGKTIKLDKRDLNITQKNNFTTIETEKKPDIVESKNNHTKDIPVMQSQKLLPPPWSIWNGFKSRHGRYNYDGEKLTYYLDSMQADFLDEPENNYYPALILAYPIEKEEWIVDFKVNYKTYSNSGKAFHIAIRFDQLNIRPNLFETSMPEKLIWYRYMSLEQNTLEFTSSPENKRTLFPKEAQYGRFKRHKNMLFGFYSFDGKTYLKIFEKKIGDYPIQRLAISGRSSSDSSSYAQYEYIKLNGEKIF